jgi:hypothetical protein
MLGEVAERQLSERRTLVADIRNDRRYLRASWHPESGVVVFSHWHDGVCTATTPVALADIPKLVGLLVNALGEAATTSISTSGRRPPGNSPSGVRSRLRQWLRPRLAEVHKLRPEP